MIVSGQESHITKQEDMSKTVFTACLLGKESMFSTCTINTAFEILCMLYDVNGMNLLRPAIRWSRLNIVRLLLSEAKRRNLTSIYVSRRPFRIFETLNTSALMMAAELGHLAIVTVLIENGARVNDLCLPLRLSPLMFACMRDRPDTPKVIALLIEAGAHVHCLTIHGDTPLHFAVANLSSSAVAKLLACELQLITIKNQLGISPMDAIEYLHEKEPQNERYHQNYQLCHIAYQICTQQLSRPTAHLSISLNHPGLSDADITPTLSGLTRHTHIRHIDLRGNKLTCLPHALLGLTQLKTINLGDNPSIKCPTERKMVNDTHEFSRIHRHLTNCKENPPVSGDRYMKVVLCGREAAGKTSLAWCLSKNKQLLTLAEREHNLSTDGVEMYIYQIDNIVVSLWDFAGQLIYETVHQFMLSQSFIYLVAWDLRQTMQVAKVDHWCHLLCSRLSECRILVVCTHLDLVSGLDQFQLNIEFEELRTQFPSVSSGLFLD